jgi:hypothetical protein
MSLPYGFISTRVSKYSHVNIFFMISYTYFFWLDALDSNELDRIKLSPYHVLCHIFFVEFRKVG